MFGRVLNTFEIATALTLALAFIGNPEIQGVVEIQFVLC